MIPSNLAQGLALGANQHFQRPATSVLAQNRSQLTSVTYATQSSGFRGNNIQQIVTLQPGTVISQPRVVPQRVVNVGPVQLKQSIVKSHMRPVSEVIQTNNSQTVQVVSQSSTRNNQQQIKRESVGRVTKGSSSFDAQKQELREQVKRLQGLLRKNQSQVQSVRRQLNSKNQSLVQFQRRLSSGQQHKSKFSVHIKSIQEQNIKLKSIIQRMNLDRDNISKSHEQYMKTDEAVRAQIFGQVQKLQVVIQQRTKELQQSKQRQLIISKQFEAFRNQAGNQLNEGQRNTVHLMEKLKVALEGKQVQIQSLNQAIHQLDANLSTSQTSRSQQMYKIKSLEAQIIQLESQNESLRQYQSKNEITFDSNQLNNLRAQNVELQRNLDAFREREKEIGSTYVGDKSSEKDVEIIKLKAALQDNQSNQLTLQYLSKQIHNYRLIIQDLQTYKENGYKKDIEITRLHQSILGKQKQIVQLENNSQEIKAKLRSIETQYRSIRETSTQQIRQLQQKCVVLNQKISVLETEKVGMAQVSSAHSQIHIAELTKALDTSRNEYFSLRKTTDEKIFELETIRGDLQGQIRSISQAVEQKQSERLFFEGQYKQLYAQFVQSKKQTPDFQPLHDEIKELKNEIFHLREENNKLKIDFNRTIENDKGRDTFNTRQELSRVRGIIENHNTRKNQQHHRQTQSINGLRQENQHLKQLLEDARIKIEQYSSDLQQCQHRMISFQDRMQNLLAGGNNRQINYQDSAFQQKQMMDQVVNELKSKLKLFKKQNDQLKRKVKQTKEESRRHRQSKDRQHSIEKSKSREAQQFAKSKQQQFARQKKQYETRLLDISSVLEAKQNRINQLTGQNQQLAQQIASFEQANNQNIQTIKEYESNVTQYEKAMNQYQARIKEYQNTMLKIKNKYKQQAQLRIPESQIIERPISNVQNVSERLEFFRSKSQQSEQRVKQLLRINNELKIQLEQTSSLIGGQNLQTQKIQVLQDSIANLEKKLMMATQQSLQMKARVQTVDDNPNLSSILELKMRQLLEQNSQLRVQISQASSQIVFLKQNQATQKQSGNEILQLQILEKKFIDLNQIIHSLQSQKYNLQSENDELKSRLQRTNIEGQNILLQQISDLQKQIYQLKVINRDLEQRIQSQSSTFHQSNTGNINMETYSTLLIQVDKIIQMTDALHLTFSNIIDDVAREGSQDLKLTIDGMVSQAVDIFKRIDIIKYSVGGLRQQSETATVIHQINQLI